MSGGATYQPYNRKKLLSMFNMNEIEQKNVLMISNLSGLPTDPAPSVAIFLSTQQQNEHQSDEVAAADEPLQ